MPAKGPRRGPVELARFAVNGIRLARSMKLRGAAREPLCLANMAIAQLDPAGALHAQRVRELDEAMVQLSSGKWWATVALRDGSRQAQRRAVQAFRRSRELARSLLARLREGGSEPVPFTPTPLHRSDTELEFAGEVPLVPEITPVVFLEGTDREMGAQYARQLVEIFGRWILQRHAGRRWTDAERAELGRWEAQHARFTPWLVDFCRGWSEAAITLGIPMSYSDVLDLWVGHRPPATDYLGGGAFPEMPPLACSGLAAWGHATADGALVTGSTGDHDLSFQVTIVAFPREGHRFIYSPFGATGDIAGAGPVWFFGHPAINDQGLAYVHHGGGPKFLEPRSEWGYGVRRAAGVIQILRTCDSAQQARDTELGWPIGDVGWGDQATVGGFWADGTAGYVIEGRKDPRVIREAGVLGERDFLYANNSVAHPAASGSEWMAKEADAWRWDDKGGWTPKRPRGMTKSLGLLLSWATGRLSTSDLLRRGMVFAYANSCARNRAAFRLLEERHGRLDVEAMKDVYRQGGTLPEGPWRKLEKEYVRTGAWGEVSVAHASNAMTVVTKPAEGVYCLCTGPARRGLAPMLPGSNITVRAETNAFWELRLASTPADVMEEARAKALELVERAHQVVREARAPLEPSLEALLQLAAAEFSAGEVLRGAGDVAALARATRAYTRAQVRAQQVSQALAVGTAPAAVPDYQPGPHELDEKKSAGAAL